MYEENQRPLPPGDSVAVFAHALAEIERLSRSAPRPAAMCGPVVQEPNVAAQPLFAAICRRLLLPESTLVGFENLAALADLATNGAACLLCMNHRSTLDVPTLYALIEDQADLAVFHRIIWISGRKLDEDSGPTPVLARCFRRIVVTPKAELLAIQSETERRERGRKNMRAYRAMRGLRNQGWVLAVFPAGTRLRPTDERTGQAIREIDSYLRRTDFLVLGHIAGCTLPVSRDRDLSHETPRLDRMVYTFGPVVEARRWREQAALRYPELSQRDASRQAIMEDIAALPGGTMAASMPTNA